MHCFSVMKNVANVFFTLIFTLIASVGISTARAEYPAVTDCKVERSPLGTVVSWDREVENTVVHHSILVIKQDFDYIEVNNLEGGTIVDTYRYHKTKPEDMKEFREMVDFVNRVIAVKYQDGTLEPTQKPCAYATEGKAKKKKSKAGGNKKRN